MRIILRYFKTLVGLVLRMCLPKRTPKLFLFTAKGSNPFFPQISNCYMPHLSTDGSTFVLFLQNMSLFQGLKIFSLCNIAHFDLCVLNIMKFRCKVDLNARINLFFLVWKGREIEGIGFASQKTKKNTQT